MDVKIIAHRGDSQHAPENSLPAFENAIAKGADAIEFDLHLTRDEQLVVHHDHQLGRTEQGSGLIGEYTLAELQQYDIGSWFDEAFKGEQMPALSDVLDLGKGKVCFEIELRCPTFQFLEMVMKEINEFGLIDDIEITSPHIPLLVHARKQYPGLTVGAFFYPYPEWKPARLGQQHLIDWMTLIDAQAAHLPESLLEREFIHRLHELNFKVHGSNLNEEAVIREAVAKGIDQFSTDRLEMALQVREKLI